MSDSPVVIDCPEPPIAEPHIPSPDSSAIPAVSVPPEAAALFDMIQRGFVPEADGSARAAAYDACQRIALALGAAPGTLAPTPAPTPAPSPAAAPAPTTPIATIVDTLRKLPREQLFDLAIERLRAALPAGVSVTAPDPVRFQLVPVMPARGGR